MIQTQMPAFWLKILGTLHHESCILELFLFVTKLLNVLSSFHIIVNFQEQKLENQGNWMPEDHRWWSKKQGGSHKFWVWYCMQGNICTNLTQLFVLLCKVIYVLIYLKQTKGRTYFWKFECIWAFGGILWHFFKTMCFNKTSSGLISVHL